MKVRDRKSSQVYGYTLIEFAIVVAMMGIFAVLASTVYVNSEKRIKVSAAAQRIQADLRYAQNIALSFKKYGGQIPRGGYGIQFTTTISGASAQYDIFADLDFDSGVAEGGSSTTLKDNRKSWSLNQWNGGDIFIFGGTCGGQRRQVTDTSPNTVTVSSAWSGCTPSSDSEYELVGNTAYDGVPELLESRSLEAGVSISVSPSPLRIIFVPPDPEVKQNDTLLAGGSVATVTVTYKNVTKQVRVNSRGFVEVQ